VEIGGQDLFIPRAHTDEQFAILQRTVEKRRICTLLGPGGCGKTALFQEWRSRQKQPEEVIYIRLDPPSTSYQSMTHMVYARILDELLDLARPAYAPHRKQYDEDTNRFGKKQLERLRKDVMRELNRRPITTLAVARIEHVDLHALDWTLSLRLGPTTIGLEVRRALVLIGQQKSKAKVEDQLGAWLNRRDEAREAWLERIDLTRPMLDETRGTKEKPGMFRRLLDEGVKAMVPDNDDRPRINEQLGKWVEQTEEVGVTGCNMSSLARLIRLLDDEAEERPGASARLITWRTIERVQARLKQLERP